MLPGNIWNKLLNNKSNKTQHEKQRRVIFVRTYDTMSRIYNHSMILYAEILSAGQCLCFIRDEGKLMAKVEKSGTSLKVR